MNATSISNKAARSALAFMMVVVLLPLTANAAFASTPPANIQAFINTYLPYAQEQYQQYGVPVSVQLALGGIESGSWNMYPANNGFFNIPNENSNPSNPSVVLNNPYTTSAVYSNAAGHWFRAYDTPEKSWLDYGYFLKHEPDYTPAWNDLANPRQFLIDIICIEATGSATDPKCDPSTGLAIWDSWTSPYDNYSKVTDIANLETYSCSHPGSIDFEAFKDGRNLSAAAISGVQFTSTYGYGALPWIVGDFASGNYNGKFPLGAYTSQGTHWAWLGEFQGLGQIKFTQGPASYFSLLVSSYNPVYVDAFDKNRNYLASAGPSPNNANTGHMTELSIFRAIADIDYVTVYDPTNFFEIDEVCTDAPGAPKRIIPVFDQTYSMLAGQQIYGSFFLDNISNTQQYLHFMVGPFSGDIDLLLTQPDGSVVSQSDPGVTYDRNANSLEVAINNAPPGEWQYEMIANQLDEGGENIHITMDKEISLIPNAPPTLTIPGNQKVQYSDPVRIKVSASDPDSSEKLVLSASGLPDGLTFSDNGDNTGTISGVVTAAPGNYPVQFFVIDPGVLTDTKSFFITVSKEDARATYTGPMLISTANSTSSKVTIPLRATIQDISAITTDPAHDPYPGAITNATVNFVDRENSNSVLCTSKVVRIDSGKRTGIAACDWPIDIGYSDSVTHTIGIQVNGYYTRDSSDNDTLIILTKPDINFVSGSGFLVNQSSRGKYAGDYGKRTDFSLMVTSIPKKTNLTGWVNVVVRNGGHEYMVRSTKLSSLVVNPNSPGKPSSGLAQLMGKASIIDVTFPRNPVIAASNVGFQIAMIDNGEPGKADTISITLWDMSGTVLFSSDWNGAKTIPQTLAGGNLIIH